MTVSHWDRRHRCHCMNWRPFFLASSPTSLRLELQGSRDESHPSKEKDAEKEEITEIKHWRPKAESSSDTPMEITRFRVHRERSHLSISQETTSWKSRLGGQKSRPHKCEDPISVSSSDKTFITRLPENFVVCTQCQEKLLCSRSHLFCHFHFEANALNSCKFTRHPFWLYYDRVTRSLVFGWGFCSSTFPLCVTRVRSDSSGSIRLTITFVWCLLSYHIQ
jgi:hypothetical protein